ncbi:uncharacterized protein LOC105686030 [Athalia rosae]|uniref:uncharacterized protein LOC105686030 n=1 Tax=Athalia rosae TaxID=37344 RepID=UPI002034943A|nr:uncharacterized protein LOC105686030 [Athalia rosae]
MSYQLLKSNMQFSYLSNKERENFFLPEDDDDEFDFEYIPASEFRNVVKTVRRQKIKMEEERAWENFVKQQELLEGPDIMLNDFEYGIKSNIKELLRDNVGNMDRELKRLEDDAMPEINKTYKSINGIRRIDAQSMAQTANKSPVMIETGTGSSNILLTIPEEQNLHDTYRKSANSTLKNVNNARKSSSDHLVMNKDHSRRLLHVMDDSEYYSSPEISPDRVSDKEEHFTRPDSMVIQRVLSIQNKISCVLDEISFSLDRIPQPDGERDLSRRLQRVSEFSVRFSRNYLYELGRHITDLQQHIRAISLSTRPRPSIRSSAFHLHVIGQKMISAHQILLQALSAYCKHIPSSIVKGHPGKLKEILQVVMDLADMCDKINITSEYYGSGDAEMQPHIKETHRKCGVIMSKLHLKSLGSDDSPVMSYTTQSTVASRPKFIPSQKRTKPKRLSSCLSMYNIEANIPKCNPSRRSSTCLPKEKKYANTSSRFLNYNQSTTSKQPNQNLPAVKSSKQFVRNFAPKARLPLREDDIRTMMDTLPSTDSDIASSVDTGPTKGCFGTNSGAKKSETKVNRHFLMRQQIPSHKMVIKESRKQKFAKRVIDDQELTKKVTMITEEHLSTLVPVIADLMSVVTSKKNDFEIRPVSSASMETLLEFLQKYQSPQREAIKLGHQESNCIKEVKSGSKNMQLICLPYKDEKGKELKICNTAYQMNPEIKPQGANIPTDAKIIITSNSGPETVVQLISPASTDSIIPEYYHKYQSFIQANPMYLSNTNNKPWDVVAWIADKLVDELVTEISKELQIDNIIKKMFDLEFEEF